MLLNWSAVSAASLRRHDGHYAPSAHEDRVAVWMGAEIVSGRLIFVDGVEGNQLPTTDEFRIFREQRDRGLPPCSTNF
jgi:hypothetical protein